MNNRDKALKLIDNLEKSLGKTLSKQRKADIEYGYLMSCKEQQKVYTLKAWDWILTHTNAMPGDAGDFIKTMEG